MHACVRWGSLSDVTARGDFQRFIDEMAYSRMPVRFLREVADSDYRIVNIGLSSCVFPTLDTMVLDDDDLAGIALIRSSSESATRAMENVYHEATHAWLDLRQDSPEVASLCQLGPSHYEGAPLAHHAKADAERIFQEALGEYVGGRVSGFWDARSKLSTWERWLRDDHDLTEASRRMMRAAVGEVPSRYDACMAARVFGYQPLKPFSKQQNLTLRAMTPQMVEFANEHFLEGKIPDRFDEARELVERWDELMHRIYALGPW